MEVHLILKPKTCIKNRFIHDWIVNCRGFRLDFEWSAIPNVGECVLLFTENGSEIYGKVTERVWSPSLEKGVGGHQTVVLLHLEIQNLDEIDRPLYDEDEDEGE